MQIHTHKVYEDSLIIVCVLACLQLSMTVYCIPRTVHVGKVDHGMYLVGLIDLHYCFNWPASLCFSGLMHLRLEWNADPLAS